MTTLFFETEGQGAAFVLVCVIGFAAAMAVDLERTLLPDRLRPLGDVLMLLLAGAAFAAGLFWLGAGAVRLYHWLALCVGAILYACGLRRAVVWLRQKCAARKLYKNTSISHAAQEGMRERASK